MQLAPSLSNFRMYLPQDWFDQDVLDAFEWVKRHPSFHYTTLVDMVNASVRNTFLPEITDPGTSPQAKGKGNSRSEVTFSTGRQLIDYMSREVTMTLGLDGFFICYFMFMFQMDKHVAGKLDGRSEFLKPVYAQLLDYEDNVIVTIRYYNIRIASISRVNFDVSDSGISNIKTYDVSFRFEGLDIEHNLGDRFNDGDSIQ